MTHDRPTPTDAPRNPWQSRNLVDLDSARILRGCLRFREELLERTPWVHFPQSGCSYQFGERRKSLPIGALFLPGDHGEDFTGTCPDCGGRILAISFGGLMNVGGATGVCVECGLRSFRYRGSLSVMANLANTILGETEFCITGAWFGGAVPGNRAQLRAALRKLGCEDLQSEEWARRSPSCEVSFCVVTGPPS